MRLGIHQLLGVSRVLLLTSVAFTAWGCGGDPVLPTAPAGSGTRQINAPGASEFTFTAWTAKSGETQRISIPMEGVSASLLDGSVGSVDEIAKARLTASAIYKRVSRFPRTSANVSRTTIVPIPGSQAKGTVSVTSDVQGRLSSYSMMDDVGTGFAYEVSYHGASREPSEVNLLASEGSRVVATVTTTYPAGFLAEAGASLEEGGGGDEGVGGWCWATIITAGGYALWVVIKTLIKAAVLGSATPVAIFLLLGDVIAAGLVTAAAAMAIAEACGSNLRESPLGAAAPPPRGTDSLPFATRFREYWDSSFNLAFAT